MFSGIIKDIGTIVDSKICSNFDQIFYIETKRLPLVDKGDSIACSGVCLTITEIIENVFIVQVSQETIKVTNLNTWKLGRKINLENAIKLSDRIDGHLVQGHIDERAKILAIDQQNFSSHELRLSCSKESMKLIAKKGSVTVDGVSLTVNFVINQEFLVNIIPYTWQNTTFQYNKVGDFLNLEIDMIARYLDRLMQSKLSYYRVV